MVQVRPFSKDYYEDVANLIWEYKEKFSDDYNPLNTKEDVISLVEKFKLNIFLAVEDDNFIGCFWAFDFLTDAKGKKSHSCTINGVAVKGTPKNKTYRAFEVYLGILYNLYGIIKVKAYVQIDKSGRFCKKNKNCTSKIYINPATKILERLRFKREAFLKGNTLKEKKLVDFLLFSRINPKYLTERIQNG